MKNFVLILGVITYFSSVAYAYKLVGIGCGKKPAADKKYHCSANYLNDKGKLKHAPFVVSDLKSAKAEGQKAICKIEKC